MSLEDLTGPNKYINALVPTNPTATDPLAQGQNHINGIKNVLLNSFPTVNAAIILPNILQFGAGTDVGSTTGSTGYVQANASPIVFTPKSASSKLLIECTGFMSLTALGLPAMTSASWSLAVGGVNIGLSVALGWSVTAGVQARLFVPGAISAIYQNVALTPLNITLRHGVDALGSDVTSTNLVFRITEYT